jgi:hypothetical protein
MQGQDGDTGSHETDGCHKPQQPNYLGSSLTDIETAGEYGRLVSQAIDRRQTPGHDKTQQVYQAVDH